MTLDEARSALTEAEEHGTPLDVEIARRALNKLLAASRKRR